MASGLIQQVKYILPDPKTYGFQSLPSHQVQAITNRLYSTHTKVSKPRRFQNGRNSAPPRRRVSDYDVVTAIASIQNKIESERQMKKLVRRLQRSTTSSETRDMDKSSEQATTPSIPLTGEALATHHKRLQRLSRPTTASSLKRLGACGYCDDKEIDCEKFDAQLESERETEPRYTPEEYSRAVKRSQTPTHASLNGRYSCSKYPFEATESKLRQEELPLISGLARSQNVEEITSRLYRMRGARTYETEYVVF